MKGVLTCVVYPLASADFKNGAGWTASWSIYRKTKIAAKSLEQPDLQSLVRTATASTARWLARLRRFRAPDREGAVFTTVRLEFAKSPLTIVVSPAAESENSSGGPPK